MKKIEMQLLELRSKKKV